jgi:iron complex outermembrane recepter protein
MQVLNNNIIIVLFSLFTTVVSAQNTITGIVRDAVNHEPLAFSQLALMAPADTSMVTGTTSDMEGFFRLETAVNGAYLLRVSFVGYNELWMSVEVAAGRNDLGVLDLVPAITELGEVEVAAAAMLFRTEADRRIFNVENMTVAEGGTAIQLLETLPSVQLDQEGNISLRGSGNVLIYINGRPSNLSSDDTESILEQYPANAIKEVELITNPSSRYDAEGVGGIINIILREERLQGFNAQLNASTGTGNKYTGGINMNYRRNKWNTFLGYSYQYLERWEETNSYREHYIDNLSPFLKQDYYTDNFDQSHLIRLASDYEVNSASTARIFANINTRSRNRLRTYNTFNNNNLNILDSLQVRNLSEDQSRINYEFGSSYAWNNDNGSRLLAQLSYAWDTQDRIEYFDLLFYDSSLTELEDRQTDQFYERPIDRNMLVFHLDYERQLSTDLELELGIRSTIEREDLRQEFGEYDRDTGTYKDLVLGGIPISNQFTHDQQIHAAYITFRDNRGSFRYQGGLRAEMTYAESWQGYGLRNGFLEDESFQPALDTITSNNYFGLFPSLYANYEISQNQDIQVSYSRRIRRPSSSAMMPFINAQDFNNLRLGNPYLQPSYTNNFEVNYIRAWPNFMFTGGAFHRHTANGFTRLYVPFHQGAMVTYTNAGVNNNTGLEIINYLTLNDNYDFTLTGNYFYSQVSGAIEGESYRNQNYSWTLSLMGNMNWPGILSAQVSTYYWGPRVFPQGQTDPVFSMNIGLRKNMINNQGTISLNASDIFNTRKFAMAANTSRFYQERSFFRESRVVTLSFTWRFRDFRERNGQRGRESIDGDLDGLF